MEVDALNQEDILAVLHESRDDAKSLKEIALAMELEMASYADWIRVERRLSSSLRALARWASWTWSAGRGRKGTGSGITPIGRLSRWAGRAALAPARWNEAYVPPTGP